MPAQQQMQSATTALQSEANVMLGQRILDLQEELRIQRANDASPHDPSARTLRKKWMRKFGNPKLNIQGLCLT